MRSSLSVTGAGGGDFVNAPSFGAREWMSWTLTADDSLVLWLMLVSLCRKRCRERSCGSFMRAYRKPFEACVSRYAGFECLQVRGAKHSPLAWPAENALVRVSKKVMYYPTTLFKWWRALSPISPPWRALRAISEHMTYYMTRRAFVSPKSNTNAREIRFKHACQNFW